MPQAVMDAAMTISREAEMQAVESAGTVIANYRAGPTPSTDIARAVLAAALPHLAPKPTESDEERVLELWTAMSRVQVMGESDDGAHVAMALTQTEFAGSVAPLLAAVRAEERAAQATQIAALRDVVSLLLEECADPRRTNLREYSAVWLSDALRIQARAALEMSANHS